VVETVGSIRAERLSVSNVDRGRQTRKPETKFFVHFAAGTLSLGDATVEVREDSIEWGNGEALEILAAPMVTVAAGDDAVIRVVSDEPVPYLQRTPDPNLYRLHHQDAELGIALASIVTQGEPGSVRHSMDLTLTSVQAREKVAGTSA
jgi:hypothetical protein